MDTRNKALNRAYNIINQYSKIVMDNGDISSHIHDLMVDLCHLLDDRKLDPEEVFASSFSVFEEETEESTH